MSCRGIQVIGLNLIKSTRIIDWKKEEDLEEDSDEEEGDHHQPQQSELLQNQQNAESAESESSDEDSYPVVINRPRRDEESRPSSTQLVSDNIEKRGQTDRNFTVKECQPVLRESPERRG
jgi:hypothetical protein